jgi:hypothetical protein
MTLSGTGTGLRQGQALGSCECGSETSGFTQKMGISQLPGELLAYQEELCYKTSVRKLECRRLLARSRRKLQNAKVDRTEILRGDVA